MADEIKIKVPDIGGATNVDVIEILVKPGDEINVDTPLITLESDKASMEIPSPKSGKISQIALKVGDKVAEGDDILTLVLEQEVAPGMPAAAASPPPSKQEEASSKPIQPASSPIQVSDILEVCIPDIGGATDVDVIEIMVAVGDTIEKDQALITLEGDKATMDIPAPAAGVVKDIRLKVGDKVAQGSLILALQTEEPVKSTAAKQDEKPAIQEDSIKVSPEASKPSAAEPIPMATNASALLFAGPAVRRIAREFGVSLAEVKGSGRKSRITKEDVQAYVKTRLAEKSTGGEFRVPTTPVIDFTKFGEIEIQPLNKIKRLTGLNVHRAWISIPHVTQFDETDITDLEAFRKSETDSAKQTDYKLTLLAFVTKVVSKALAVYPQFNASLDSSGENLIYKHYTNIGIAVETANGLVVPVIKEVDRLSVAEIAQEMARLSAKARNKGLMPADMSGGCFTISSLGGIGGTAFTPIVNSPEVAILGLSRSSIKPVYVNGEFKPRLMLPLSLSYDHRVIDGAEAARFTRFIAETLTDIRRVLL